LVELAAMLRRPSPMVRGPPPRLLRSRWDQTRSALSLLAAGWPNAKIHPCVPLRSF